MSRSKFALSTRANFDFTVASEVRLGLQVTTSAPPHDMVVGFLPIAQRPAAAQISGVPAVAAVTYPELNRAELIILRSCLQSVPGFLSKIPKDFTCYSRVGRENKGYEGVG
jgi:hypothetical protein